MLVPSRLMLAEAKLARLPADDPARPEMQHKLALELLHRDPVRAMEFARLAAACGDSTLAFDALATEITALLALSRFEEADSCLEQLRLRCDRPVRQARACALAAMRAQRGADLPRALSLSLESLALYENSGEAVRSRGVASAHNLAGNLLSQFGDYLGALEQFQAALAVYAEDPEDDVTAVVSNNLGRAHLELRQYEAAEAVLQSALHRFPEEDRSFVRVALLLNLGRVKLESRQHPRARKILEQALECSLAAGFRRLTGAALHNLGLVAQAEGELQGALRHFEAALAERRNLAERLDVAESEVAFAAALEAVGRDEEAMALVQELLDHPDAVAWRKIRSEALFLKYRLHRARGELEAALEAHVAYHEACRVVVDDQSNRRYQALEVRFRVEQMARSREQERARLDGLHQMAHADPLTGLPNRRFFDSFLDAALCQAAGSSKGVVLALLDVDHFKRINDGHSHAVGDTVLKTLGSLIRQQLRAGDVVARVGGEEFAIVFPQIERKAAVDACERVLGAIRRHGWHVVSPGLLVTASIGLTSQMAGRAEMRDRADMALYQAKAEGRDRLVATA